MPRIACDNCLYEFNVSKQLTGGVRCPECGSTVSVGAPPRKKKTSSASIPTPSGGQLPPRVGGHSAQSELPWGTIKAGAIAGGAVAVLIAIVMFATGGGDDKVVQPAPTAFAGGGGAVDGNGGDPAPIQPRGSNDLPDKGSATTGDGSGNSGEGDSSENAPGGHSVASATGNGGTIEKTSSSAGGADPQLGTPEEQSEMAAQAGGEPPADGAGLMPVRTESRRLVDLVSMIEPSVVRLNIDCGAGSTHGSGFVADEAGTVITNFHVVVGAKHIEAVFADGREIPVAGIRAADPARDIAILQLVLAGKSVTPIPIADDLPPQGASVYGFGSPQGLDFTTSAGIVSAVRDAAQMQEISDSIGQLQGTWLQTSAPISGGSSGGPLVDEAGNVVGINSMTMITGQNLNFAISCLDLREFYQSAAPQITPFHAADMAPPTERATREFARTEIETARGYGLFAEIDDVVVVPSPEIAKIDTSGRLWGFTRVNLEYYADRMDIDLSYGKPESESTVLMIFMTFEEESGGNVPMHDVNISANLVCYDPSAPDSRHYVRVWHDEANVGKVSMQLLARGGRLSNRADGNLRGFFSNFRSAHNAAINFQKRQADGE